MMEDMQELIRCYGCGAWVKDTKGVPHKYIGAAMGCWEIYGEILAKEYGEYGYPEPTHRLTVDTYAVQHPGKPSRQSIQSVNVHLVRLYLVLEKGVRMKQATTAMGRVLRNADKFAWLDPPQPNGHITVVDVIKARNIEEHTKLVEAWAKDVWKAWAIHHEKIRRLVKQYLKE
jgi:hypothetical protein